ncbi:MAG TPA: hypothetical protein VFU13_05115 [Steroidobacteraceae bacterium]|nr:hypothetical protein [Steroidobacteraceae bacterium]
MTRYVLPILAGTGWLMAAGWCHAGVNSWTRTGPEGGMAKAVTFHPAEPDTVLVSTGAGVFRSTDSGLHWERTLANTHSEVTDIQFDPTSSNRVVAFDQSVAFSEDGGQTFRGFYLANNEPLSAMAFSQDGTLYVVALSGTLFKTGNLGANWTQVTVPWTGSNAPGLRITADPGNRNVLYVCRPGSGLYKTIDAGVTWTLLPGSPGSRNVIDVAWQLAVKPGDGSVLIAATSDGFMRSGDGGATWETQMPGTFPASVAFDPASPANVIAITFAGDLLRSTDSGATWPANLQRPRLRANYSTQIVPHPAVAGRLFVGSSDGPLYSADGGATFEQRARDLRAGRISSFSAADNGDIYASLVFPARVFRRTGTWSPVNNEGLFASASAALNVTGVATSARNSSALYVLDYAGRLLKSSDHGATWNAPPASLSTQLLRAVAVDPVDAARAYVATHEGVWRTTDGGLSWQRSAGASTEIDKIVVSPSSRQVIYASSMFNTRVFRSGDGGVNFLETAALPATGQIGALNVDPNNAQIVYAIAFAQLVKTTDGGATWTALPANDASGAAYNIGSAVLVDPVHPTTLTIPSNAQHRGFIRSVDGGATWARTALDIGGKIALYSTAGILHPNQPTLLIAAYEDQGVAEYEVATDLQFAFTIPGSFPAGPFPAGHSTPVTLLIMNQGPHGASPSTLRLTLPSWLTGAAPGCTYAAPALTCPVAPFQSGQTRPLTVTLTAEASAHTGAIQVSLTTHERDLDPTNNSFTLDGSSSFQSDLGVTVTPDASVLVGGAISRTITVTNRGPSESPTSTVTATVPTSITTVTVTPSRGTCSVNAGNFACQLGSMASGASATIAFTATASVAGDADVVATAVTTNDDRNLPDNTARLRTTITSPPPPGPPAPAPKRGGGGSLDWLALLLLGGLLLSKSRLRGSVRR